MGKHNRTSGGVNLTAGGSKKRIARNAQAAKSVDITGSDGVGKRVFHGSRVIGTSRGDEMIEAVMRGAADEGLMVGKDGRIASRVSSELIAKAKARTGLQSDTELVEFALATIALDDNFAAVFRDVKGSVDPDLDVGL